MSFISSVPFNVAGPVANVLAVSVAQAMGAAGANPTAKLLLPSAVTAPVLVPGYASETPRTQAKTLPKLSSNQATSAFTAQLLAQAPQSAPEEPAALVPRAQTTPGNVGNKPEGNGGNAAVFTASPQPTAPAPAPVNASAASAATAPATTAANLTLVTTAPRAQAPNTAAGLGQPQANSKSRATVSSTKGAAVYQATSAYDRKLNYVPIEAVG